MKAADITIGTAYEIHEGGSKYRATVTAVERKTRRVYGASRSDMGGHISTSIVVTIDGKYGVRDVLPAAVKRLWADAEPEYDAAENLKESVAAACAALRIVGIDAAPAWKTPGRISLGYISLDEADALVLRLATGTPS